MYVCLCAGVTSQQVIDAVRDGAATTKQVGERTGAGAACGRCRTNIRALISTTLRESRMLT
ncbi:bacterioferritin-associated ferredoxin [Mycobacterium sp. SMC-14]|uniref:(2Fe-2S)-binding protein n=1 Tax=Mycobacterium sp. SMC-14 TaxID=3385968 RepID=UPI00390C6A0F